MKTETKRRFRKVAVGGTFDELHRGHKVLLNTAFQVGEYVLIGLTSDEYIIKMNKPHIVAPYYERLAMLVDFLEKSGFESHFEISPLYDPYGITLKKTDLDALIVSQETAKTCEIINKKRTKIGLSPLNMVKINLVHAENKKPISTTSIRANEIDKNGNIIKHNRLPAKLK